MNNTQNHHENEAQEKTMLTSDTKNTCQNTCKSMCHGKKFWIGATFRILLMVWLIIAAYRCGVQYWLVKWMWMNSMWGMQQWHFMKGMKDKGDMRWQMMNRNTQNTPQQTNDGVPVMNITEGTGTTTWR